MSQTAIEHPVISQASPEAAPARRVAISARFLLGIYAIVPLCLVAMIVDRVFVSASILRTLPDNNFYFQLLFGTPHIIGSSILLAANGNYLRTYWLRLILFSILLALFFGVGRLYLELPFEFFLAIVGAATVVHVIKQQVGIGKGMCRLSSWVYDAWGWTLIVFGSILYYCVYADFPEITAWAHGTLWALAAVAFALTLVCHVMITSTMGRLYLWANAIMTLQAGLFYAEGYSFLAVLGPRLVHDVTAFTFYVVHDMNRHGADSRNVLYRLPSKLGLGVFWVCPVLAVLLTWLISRYTDPLAELLLSPILGSYTFPYSLSFIVIGYLGMLHYFTEAFTWKQGSPYRQHFAMSA